MIPNLFSLFTAGCFSFIVIIGERIIILYMSFFDSFFFKWIFLPLGISLIRICDVSIGTLRIVLIAKGNKYVAPVLGFFEILIWLLAISRIMQNLNNIVYYIAYAGGFALGNLIGMIIEEKLAMGIISVKIITKKSALSLIETLKTGGYGITIVPGQGMEGEIHIVYTIIKRQNLDEVIQIIKKHNPMAFYMLEDIRFVSKELSPFKEPELGSYRLSLLKRRKKDV